MSLPREWIDQRPAATAHAADQLAGDRSDDCVLQKREGTSAAQFAATLIRHAPPDQPPAVLALAVTVIEPSLQALLVPSVRRAALLTPSLLPTPLRAVPLPPVAAAAHVERSTACLGTAKPLA
jgi:hypothetical protein